MGGKQTVGSGAAGETAAEADDLPVGEKVATIAAVLRTATETIAMTSTAVLDIIAITDGMTIMN
jgi:hypothetical protein